MKLRRNSVTGKIKTFKELDDIIHIKQITFDKNGKDMEINSICKKEEFDEKGNKKKESEKIKTEPVDKEVQEKGYKI